MLKGCSTRYLYDTFSSLQSIRRNSENANVQLTISGLILQASFWQAAYVGDAPGERASVDACPVRKLESVCSPQIVTTTVSVQALRKSGQGLVFKLDLALVDIQIAVYRIW